MIVLAHHGGATIEAHVVHRGSGPDQTELVIEVISVWKSFRRELFEVASDQWLAVADKVRGEVDGDQWRVVADMTKEKSC